MRNKNNKYYVEYNTFYELKKWITSIETSVLKDVLGDDLGGLDIFLMIKFILIIILRKNKLNQY